MGLKNNHAKLWSSPPSSAVFAMNLYHHYSNTTYDSTYIRNSILRIYDDLTVGKLVQFRSQNVTLGRMKHVSSAICFTISIKEHARK